MSLRQEEARRIFRFTRIDVLIAMSIAGLINISMLVMAATVFYGSGLLDVDSLEGAHETLAPILGGASSTLFALALVAPASRAPSSGRCPARWSCRGSSAAGSRSSSAAS